KLEEITNISKDNIIDENMNNINDSKVKNNIIDKKVKNNKIIKKNKLEEITNKNTYNMNNSKIDTYKCVDVNELIVYSDNEYNSLSTDEMIFDGFIIKERK
ncbi:hypothetical protein SLOPH_678, partial [Spraguea lophii 42_110]